MNNKSSFEKSGGTYRMVNGYKIPNLDLPEEAKKPLGRWGQAHLDYLSHNKQVLLTTMLANGSLWKYLQETDKQAQEMFEALVEDMCIDNDITEELKEKDQMKWVQEMNRIYSFAAELVLEDLIYS